MVAYNNQVTDDPTHATFYLECLQQIGISLHNKLINQYVETELEKGMYTRFELQRAYKTLEIDHPEQIGDDGIDVVFSIRCDEAPHRRKDFERAMAVIEYFKKGRENKGNNFSVDGDKTGILML